tara:strand:- start:8943 stop:9194 length:252 start_codon:yes stop_codon:yes gene_type:complete
MSDFNQHDCMINSYLVITGKLSVDDLIKKNISSTFIFNPTRKHIPLEGDVYDILIDYFATIEDYEKCSEMLYEKKLAKILINI